MHTVDKPSSFENGMSSCHGSDGEELNCKQVRDTFGIEACLLKFHIKHSLPPTSVYVTTVRQECAH